MTPGCRPGISWRTRTADPEPPRKTSYVRRSCVKSNARNSGPIGLLRLIPTAPIHGSPSMVAATPDRNGERQATSEARPRPPGGEIVIHSASDVLTASGGGFVGGGGEEWRKAARAVRKATAHFGRTTWTPELNRWLIKSWAHLNEHQCGSVADLADSLGTTPQRLRAQLANLRKRLGEKQVPKGKPGRRATSR